MNEQTSILKVSVAGLTQEREPQVRELLAGKFQAERVDINREKQLMRIISAQPLTLEEVRAALRPLGIVAQPLAPPPACNEMQIGIDGMHCRSCEILIERNWKKIPGVEKVTVNADRGTARICYRQKPALETLQAAVAKDGYAVRESNTKTPARQSLSQAMAGGQKHENTPKSFASGQAKTELAKGKRPSIGQLIGLFALVLVLGKIMSGLGFLKPNVALGAGTSLGAIFLLGLVAAASSCIAVSGGLMLSAAAKYREKYGTLSRADQMKPVWLFVLGRIVSYTVLGGLIGALGNALSPSPFVTGLITIVAALYMLIMGLDMLHLAPAWLKSFLPRLPKFLSHRVMDGENKAHPAMPFALGAGTFFLPCGFTQALQLYALTTGSFTQSALTLGVFALGTAPALIGLGLASGSLKGKAGSFFFRFSGALVVVLGLWNIQNGFTITGHPLSLAWLSPNEAAYASDAGRFSGNDPNVTYDGRAQTVRMSVGDRGYQPNRFTIRAGVPTTWLVDMDGGGGCISVLVSRQLGVQTYLKKGTNTITFTAPKEPGTVAFSCSMGMFRGQFTVIPNT